MKKLLIASAALAMVAGTAQAQSSVTVYGVLDIGYTATDSKFTASNGTSITNKSSSTGNGDGALATSRFGVRGSEDLGGGRKANFVLEYDLVDAGVGGTGALQTTTANTSTTTATNTNGFGARYSWVGLEDAKLGQLRLGRQEQSIHSVLVGGSAGMANNVSGAIYSAGAADINNQPASIRPHNVFLNRAITYISPRMSGFTVEVQTANQEIEVSGTTQNVKASENGASLKYSAGKLNLAYGMAEVKQQTATTGDNATVSKQQGFAANYDLGMARVFALYAERENKLMGALVQKTKATEIGVQVPMGKTTLWASGFDGERDGSDNSAVAAGFNGLTVGGASNTQLTNFNKATADVSGYQVGAMYNLSKRTAVYGIYGKQEIKATTGSATGAKVASDAVALGVRHSF
jgi:predicted porin